MSDPWRNGSASDSRSEGCVFDSRRVHFYEIFFLFFFLYPLLFSFFSFFSSAFYKIVIGSHINFLGGKINNNLTLNLIIFVNFYQYHFKTPKHYQIFNFIIKFVPHDLDKKCIKSHLSSYNIN